MNLNTQIDALIDQAAAQVAQDEDEIFSVVFEALLETAEPNYSLYDDQELEDATSVIGKYEGLNYATVNTILNQNIVYSFEYDDEVYHLIDSGNALVDAKQAYADDIATYQARQTQTRALQQHIFKLFSAKAELSYTKNPEGGCSAYMDFSFHGVDDEEVLDVSVRVKDHAQNAEGGFNQGTGERYGATDIDIYFDDNQQLFVHDTNQVLTELMDDHHINMQAVLNLHGQSLDNVIG